MRRFLGLLLGWSLVLQPACRRRSAPPTTPPLKGAFSRVGPLVDGRMAPRAVALGTGQILLMTGAIRTGDMDGDSSGNTELFDPDSRAFYELPAPATPRVSQALVRLGDGDVLVVGGRSRGRTLASLERFRLAKGTWTAFPGQLPEPREACAAVPMKDGRAAVLGGIKEDGSPAATVVVVDPLLGRTWNAGKLATPRSLGFSATLLLDGRILVAGGRTPLLQATAEAELFDPVRGTTTPLPPMGTAREGHAAVMLRDGRVLLAGGRQPDPRTGKTLFVEAAEVYDPVTGTFKPVGTMTVGRVQPAATLLGDGQVLICGGVGPFGALNLSELFDPARLTFAPGPLLESARGDDVAMPLPSGGAIVFGSDLDVAEIYE